MTLRLFTEVSSLCAAAVAPLRAPARRPAAGALRPVRPPFPQFDSDRPHSSV